MSGHHLPTFLARRRPPQPWVAAEESIPPRPPRRAPLPRPGAKGKTTRFLIEIDPAPSSEGDPPLHHLAGVWRRIGALLIDDTILFLLLFVWNPFELGTRLSFTPIPEYWYLFGTFSVSSFYFVAMEWRFGQTIGKRALGIQVRRLDGRPVRFHQALIRQLLVFADLQLFGLVGVLLVILRRQKQRLGDIAARTVVVRVAARPVLELWLHSANVPMSR